MLDKAPFVRAAASLCFAAMLLPAGAALAAEPDAAAVASAPPASPIEGVWLTAAKSELTVAPCPDGFCGSITKIVVPDDIYKQNKAAIESMGGADHATDVMNKDPALRSRPILGLQILTLHAGNKPQIYDGTIYNPQDGNTYSGYVEVLGPDKIRLNGCILYNTICKGEDWTRVPQPEPEAADDAATPTTAMAGKKPAAHAHAAPAATVEPGTFQ
ncbi:MAG TPA: DUF2147 domain-containing protein [Devosia sp.]|nr:DUF2147 domain-containing protein [Devosia sp.]